MRICGTPAIKPGAVLVIHGEHIVFEGSIRDTTWTEIANRPGAVTLMDPANKAILDRKVAEAQKGAPLA